MRRISFLRLARFKHLLKNKYFLVAFFGISAIGGFLIYGALNEPETKVGITTTTKAKATTTTEKLVTSKLLGKKTAPSSLDKQILAIVVENSPEARPQSGLDKASIVYETISEGGITRFLALFQENEASEIGPVRSARTFFVDWALEYGAYFAHVGGNIDALDMMKPYGVFDINQFYFGSYFWRDNSRYAPHNVYTTTEKIRAAGEKSGYSNKSTFAGLTFKDDKRLEERPATASVLVNFSSGTYNPSYTYDRQNNVWQRSIAGMAFKERRTGLTLTPKNVVVEFTNFSYGETRLGEKSTRITTVGKGSALFFIDGEKIEGTWEKADKKSQTKFKDLAGNEIKFNSGQTWIEVVPAQNAVTYTRT